MAVVVVVVAAEALGRLGVAVLDDVVAQADDVGVGAGAVVEQHLGLVDIELAVDVGEFM